MELIEAYIKAEKGNIYYTKNSDMFLSMVKSIFISKNIPVRVYYDTIKQMYVFGDATNYIHADLATGMKYHSNVYGTYEMRANISYLKQNCALFQVLPNDDFKKYDMGDGYSQGWFLKLDDLIFACRNKEYHKVRDEVPLFKDHIGEWNDVQYYLSKKNNLNESVAPKLNDNFWEWFGNSKVVDSQGNPLVVYHGTDAGKFDTFNMSDKWLKGIKCAYFSSDYDTAASYCMSGYPSSFYLKIENPYILDANYSKYDSPEKCIEKALENAYKGSYDGAIVLNIKDDAYQEYEEGVDYPYSTTYIVFNSNQIKSVDNNGNWSLTSNNINESVNNRPELIIAYRGIDSEKFKFKNGVTQWFSSYISIAKTYGDIIYKVKLKLNNPADLTNDKELYMILKDMIKEYEESYRSRYNQLREYLIEYIKEIYPDFDISNIDDNTLIRLSKKLKNVPYNMENNISLFNELNIMLDCISKQESWAGLFHEIIYPNWDRVIKTVQEQGYDSIISYEEASDRSYTDIGYVIWNNENIVSIKKLNKNINESVEDKILYIIRGVPGSGKSTLAHKLTDNVVEADQYFYDDKGNYNWSADKLNQAHNWCYNTVKKYMEESRDKIAVANTFVKNRDYKRYVELAKEFGYKVDIRTCTGNYQNIHNVPDETVERMRSKFQETPLDESVKLKNKYVFPEPDCGNLNELIDPNDRYRYWVDGVQAKIEKPYKENIPVNKIRQDYDGEDICDYDYDQFDNGIDTPIEVLKYRDQYILMDGHHRAAYAKEKGLKTILAYVWDADKLEQLDESAENDKTLRDYAVKLTNICLDALVKTKYETKISKDQVQINVDKAFKKAVPMLKYSSYEYFLLLVNEKDEPNPSFGKTVDKKYGLITFPIFSSDPSDLALSILYKHKSVLEKLYTTYSGDELKLKIHEYAVKYLKNEIKKRLERKKNTYLGLLIHECTHLLDDVRRTKTYKSKEQELKDDKGIETYYNSPEEQNAYYQETISIFDEWANQSVGYKTFDIFWDDFIRQYKGEYNLLNDKNKRKLKKRAYAYWYIYMKD